MTKGVIRMEKNIKGILKEIKDGEFSDYLLPHIEFNSNCEVIIDGNKGILQYNGNVVKLNCGNLVLKFSGDNLSIRSQSSEQIIVSGQIVSFEFCSV